MKRFWQRKRYAMVAWEAYEYGQAIFRGNTAVDYKASDRSILADELKRGMAEHATKVMGREVKPGQVMITGFFPVP